MALRSKIERERLQMGLRMKEAPLFTPDSSAAFAGEVGKGALSEPWGPPDRDFHSLAKGTGSVCGVY